jgi:hypothetical protein
MRRAALLLLAGAGVGLGLVQGYSVAPRTAAWSGWTRYQDTVSQLVTCNFDSLSYVELFAGDKGNVANAYVATVYEDGDPVMFATQNQLYDCEWIKFENWNNHQSFTKGKQYEFKFTRSGQDSINYYYQNDEPYAYGDIKVDGDIVIARDLCMRTYGTMEQIDATYWGASVAATPWDAGMIGACCESLQSAGVGWATIDVKWSDLETTPGTWAFGWLDMRVESLASNGIEPTGILVGCPKWASTRIHDWTWRPDEHNTDGGGFWDRDTSIYCAPRNLWPAMGDTNYWARFVDTVAKRYVNRIHSYLVWNEQNDTCTDTSRYRQGITGWWRRPDTIYDIGQGLRPMCSLYVRMAELADSAIGNSGQVVFGGLYRSDFVDNDNGTVSGSAFLDTCYVIVGDTGVCWDAVAVHPYHDGAPCSQESLDLGARNIREVMQRHNDYGELWQSEVGWRKYEVGDPPVADPDLVARATRAVAEMFVGCQATTADPSTRGGYDRACYWFAWENNSTWGHVPLLDRNFGRYSPFYAFQHVRSQLNGRQLNGRVMLGDERDNSVRIYEFENPADGHRTWVAWRNDNGTRLRTTDVRIPARSDGLTSALLAYSAAPTVAAKSASASGWLPVRLGTRPVFVTESTAVNRPDLVTDSVRFDAAPRAGEAATLRAWVRNTGRSTPDVSLTCAFSGNGESLGVATRTEPIGHNATAVFTLSLARVPESLRGAALFSATVNPRQSIVEAGGLDDNTVHLQALVQ